MTGTGYDVIQFGSVTRRRFVALSAALGAMALPRLGQSAAPPQDILFRVLLKGGDIGTHRVTFAPTAVGFDVDIGIDLTVKVAFITAYRYEQLGHDSWSGGRLVGASYRTNDNGKLSTLQARAESSQLTVQGASGKLELPPGTMTDLGFWNEAIIKAPMIVDSQTGEAGQMQSGTGTPERIVVRGSEIPATRYAVSATKGRTGSVWYSADGHWVKAQIITRGHTLDYELA